MSVAYLNTMATSKNKEENNYSFLVHTSGKTDDHKADRMVIESAMRALVEGKGPEFKAFATILLQEAKFLYPRAKSLDLTGYIIANASRSTFIVLNSKRDRASAGDKPTVPTCPFTVIIGGNIVSRGVTFPNLLSMFFSRDVKTKLQQDTYIQRARMFGSRGTYLNHFELTIPSQLYADWHRCFVFHRLALQAIKNNKVSPVWVGDQRISVAASSSIDRGTVDLDKGEMSFQIFDCPNLKKLDEIVTVKPKSLATLEKLAEVVGKALPAYLIDYLRSALRMVPGTLAIHTSSSIEQYKKSADKETISRKKGFIGNPQLE
ncbi:MAG: Z1 domain-containing protein, partial [Nitrospiraceae bacterium]